MSIVDYDLFVLGFVVAVISILPAVFMLLSGLSGSRMRKARVWVWVGAISIALLFGISALIQLIQDSGAV